MKIYFIHPSSYPNYLEDLYHSFKYSTLSEQHTFIFPHEEGKEAVNSKNTISDCDLIIAEVSYPSTGEGIELGWADSLGRKVLCIHKEDAQISSSLKTIFSDILSYSDKLTMVKNVAGWIESYEKELEASSRNVISFRS